MTKTFSWAICPKTCLQHQQVCSPASLSFLIWANLMLSKAASESRNFGCGCGYGHWIQHTLEWIGLCHSSCSHCRSPSFQHGLRNFWRRCGWVLWARWSMYKFALSLRTNKTNWVSGNSFPSFPNIDFVKRMF